MLSWVYPVSGRSLTPEEPFLAQAEEAYHVVHFPEQGFSMRLPEGWSTNVGNAFGPHLPADTVTLGHTSSSYDVSIVPVALEDWTSEETTDFATALFGTYQGLPDHTDLTFSSSRLRSTQATRAICHEETPDESIKVTSVSEFVLLEDRGYWISTNFYSAPGTSTPLFPEGVERLRVFELAVQSFSPLTVEGNLMATITPEDLRRVTEGTDIWNSPTAIQSAFVWPTSGYIGYLYSPSGHNGIDIWTRKSCDSLSTDRGNPVYAAATGTLDYVYKIPGGAYDGVRINYGTVNDQHTWTHYWHLGSYDPGTGQQTSFVTTGVGSVNSQTKVGYQGNLYRQGNEGGVATTCIHLHVTVANGNVDSAAVDPSPYFGVELREGQSNIGWLDTYVQHPAGAEAPPIGTSCIKPLLRYWNDTAKRHFYTQNWDELGAGTSGWQYEGFEGYVAANANCYVSSASPLYRFWHSTRRKHFYTASPSEREVALQEGFTEQGSAGYVLRNPDGLHHTQPLYRAVQPTQDNHFYTTDWNEIEHAVDHYGYVYEKIAAYVFTAEAMRPPSNDCLDPLLRYWNEDISKHFYTQWWEELGPGTEDGWSFERAEGYVANSSNCYAPGAQPLYRSYHPVQRDHFYTTDWSEMEYAVDHYGFRYEGITGYVLPEANSDYNTRPLYRCYNADQHNHFYTTSWTEVQNAIDQWGYRYERREGYVFSSAALEDNSTSPEPVETSSTIVLDAESGRSSVRLDWSPTNDPTVDSYLISRAIGGSPVFNPLDVVVNTTYSDLAIYTYTGAEYCYRVEALRSDHTAATVSEPNCVRSNEIKVEVPEIRGATGETLIVPVTIQNADELRIADGAIWLNYDDSILELIGVSPAALGAAYDWTYSLVDAGDLRQVRVTPSFEGDMPPLLYGSGALFWFTFDVTGISGTSPLDLQEYADGTGGTFFVLGDSSTSESLLLQDGVFHVDGQYELGDLNGNGAIETVDAKIALQIASGQFAPSALQAEAGDVNGDNVLGAADASMILHRVAGGIWPLPNSTAERSYQETPIVVHLDDAAGLSGAILDVTLSAENMPEWTGAEFIVVYDSDAFEATSDISVTGLARDFTLEYSEPVSGLLHISMASDTPVTGSGELAIISLRSTNDVSEAIVTPITLASAKLNDAAGRDFFTSALQRTVTRENAQLRIEPASRIFLPLILRARFLGN
jgi:hypothetical protein